MTRKVFNYLFIFVVLLALWFMFFNYEVIIGG